MPRKIPSLREQLLCVKVGGPSVISADHYGLLMSIINELEMLKEAVEPEDTDATIRKLREERDGANERLEIRRTLCQSWEGRCHKAERELAEAKAETESWTRRCHELERLLACDKASVADAEIGRLVRNMRRGSRLQCSTLGSYAVWELGIEGWDFAKGKSILYSDPTEALRSIQEVGDAKA